MKRLTKKLLAVLLASMFTTTTYASANIPTWTTAQQESGKSSVYLNWDVDIPSQDIISTEDFDGWYMDVTKTQTLSKLNLSTDGYKYDASGNYVLGQDIPHTNAFKAGDGFGVNGSYGLQWKNTIGNGWNYNLDHIKAYGPVDPSKYNSVNIFGNDFYRTKKDKNIIVRINVKGTGKILVGLSYRNDGGLYLNSYGLTWAENLTASEVRSRMKAKQKIKINNPNNKSVIQNVAIANAPRPSGSYNFSTCTGSMVKEGSQWYFVPDVFREHFNFHIKPDQSLGVLSNDSITVGTPIYVNKYGAGSSANMTPNSTTFKEYSVNLNLTNNNPSDYYFLQLEAETATTLNVDDLQIAYAPYTLIYRNNQLIYQGYTVEYTDTAKLDTAAPNPPTVNAPTYNTSNGNVTLTWNAAADNGTTHTYTLKSKNSDGVISAVSASKSVKVTSGLKGYKVYYNGTSTETTARTITLTPAQFKNVRIVAVDKDGNESTSSYTFALPAKPVITATKSSSAWAKQNSISYTFASNSYISTKKMNTTVLQSLSGTQSITKNGVYNFTATDAYNQNATPVSVTITNIDSINPLVTVDIN